MGDALNLLWSGFSRDALPRFLFQSDERSIAYGARVTFLLRGQEKSNQKRRPPRLALAAHPWAASP
jgi:hypothetical protein